MIGCQSGGRSLRAAEALLNAGYTAIIEQRAGYKGARDAFGAVTEPGWEPLGLPVETTTAGRAYDDLRKLANR